MSTSIMLAATDMVVFGGMGDLSLRKLIPALYYRFQEKQWDPRGRIFILGRVDMTRTAFEKEVSTQATKYILPDDFKESTWASFLATFAYAQIDAEESSGFWQLKKLIEDNSRPIRVFYFATPASIFGTICQQLKSCDLITLDARVVIEKPLGFNLESFKSINASILQCFQESQVYRIDHYLGKETVQNLMVLRFANNIFERLWTSDNVEHVQITVAESIGVGTRGNYYDESGALRDMVQNHLLQLLCLVAMEAPSHITPDFVRDEKLKVLNSLRPIGDSEVQERTVRGQYQKGSVEGQKVNGYCEDIGKSSSNTETYVALKVHVDNWRWSGVPFFLRTGKRLEKRYSEIVIQFKPVPLNIFPESPGTPETNKLIIRLQPDESVKLQMITKIPGPGGYRFKPVYLNLSFAETFDHRIPDAYERLLMDVVRGNPTLFMRSDEVEAAWTWTEKVLNAWKHTQQKIQLYPAGTPGPIDAALMLGRQKASWHEEIKKNNFKEFKDQESLVKDLTAHVSSLLQSGIQENGKASIVVSGGSTPKPFFNELQKADLDWSKVFMTCSDERWVSRDHLDSNEKLIRDFFVNSNLNTNVNSKVNNGVNIVSLKNDSANPFLGVAETNRNLAQMSMPFDIVILGMGSDGHTASFFPGSPDLSQALHTDSANIFCAGLIPPAYAPHPRMTLTLPTLLNTKKIIILMTGIEKKMVYEKALEEGSVEDLPIRAILRQKQTPVEVYWTK